MGLRDSGCTWAWTSRLLHSILQKWPNPDIGSEECPSDAQVSKGPWKGND